MRSDEVLAKNAIWGRGGGERELADASVPTIGEQTVNTL